MTSDNLSYGNLRQTIENGLAGVELNQFHMSKGFAAQASRVALDAILPAIRELEAKALEYEHAIEHATDPHDGPVCPDCQKLCQSALDGVNREDFREMVSEDDG